jgi:aromatic ring-opening dioxygenase LigB subunit
MIARGAVVPHAPVLLEAVQPSLDEGRRLRKAISELDFSEAEAVVIVSAHGHRAGIYERVEGSLSGFGIEGLEVERESHAELVRAVSDAWSHSQLDAPADFGVVVPLLLGVGEGLPVVAATLPETTGPRAARQREALDEARTLSKALREVAEECDVAIVASAHSSAGLADRAPLTIVPGAEEVDRELVAALEKDPGLVEGLLERLHRTGDACGAGPLAVIAHLFAGWTSGGLTYEAPYGVGYLVGQWKE